MTTGIVKIVVLVVMLAMMVSATHYVNKKVDEVKGNVIYARRKARYAPSYTVQPSPLINPLTFADKRVCSAGKSRYQGKRCSCSAPPPHKTRPHGHIR